jgi:hypothetical protein
MTNKDPIVQAAYELGYDDVLFDPTDEDIVLYAVELVHGDWPYGFEVGPAYAEKIVAAYEKGEEKFLAGEKETS